MAPEEKLEGRALELLAIIAIFAVDGSGVSLALRWLVNDDTDGLVWVGDLSTRFSKCRARSMSLLRFDARSGRCERGKGSRERQSHPMANQRVDREFSKARC